MRTHRTNRDEPSTRAVPGPRTTRTSASSPGNLLDLQRTTGNRNVAAIVADTARADAPTVQRVPAAPAQGGVTGALDRSKVAIGEISDIVVDASSGTPTFPAQQVSPTVSDPAIVSLAWELFDPNDVRQPAAAATTAGAADALTKTFTVGPASFTAPIVQGRSLVRCTGRNAGGQPVAYSDRSFFVWTTEPISHMDSAELNAIKGAPGSHSLGELGAANARSMMLEHRAAVAATGTGRYMGNRPQAGPVPAGVTQEDCTTYVLKVLGQTFRDKGRDADWQAILTEARTTSAGAFKGTELLKALQTKAGWKAVFWAPDPRNPTPGRTAAEPPFAYRRVREAGTYYGVAVDKDKSVVNYRRTAPTSQEEMTKLDELRRVPLGVIAAKGGLHMTLIINGQVYEVHWDRPPTDPDVIEATPLEKWVWESGVVVMPAEDFAKVWAP